MEDKEKLKQTLRRVADWSEMVEAGLIDKLEFYTERIHETHMGERQQLDRIEQAALHIPKLVEQMDADVREISKELVASLTTTARSAQQVIQRSLTAVNEAREKADADIAEIKDHYWRFAIRAGWQSAIISSVVAGTISALGAATYIAHLMGSAMPWS